MKEESIGEEVKSVVVVPAQEPVITKLIDDDVDVADVVVGMVEKKAPKDEFENSLKVAADPKDVTEEERKRNVKKLAGAISHALRTNGTVNVRAFGHAAIGKACKALAIAKNYIEETDKIQLAIAPAFITTQIDGMTLTGIKFSTCTTEKEESFSSSRIKNILKVKADPKDISPQDKRTNVRKLAGAIAHVIEQDKECLVRCFGNASINKACKALAIARGLTASRGPDLYCWIEFIVTMMGDKERTGVCFVCYSNE